MVDALSTALDTARGRRRLPAPALRRQLREAAGIPQAVLAQTLGVAPPTVSRWESGVRSPRDPRILARYLDVLERLAREGMRQ